MRNHKNLENSKLEYLDFYCLVEAIVNFNKELFSSRKYQKEIKKQFSIFGCLSLPPSNTLLEQKTSEVIINAKLNRFLFESNQLHVVNLLIEYITHDNVAQHIVYIRQLSITNFNVYFRDSFMKEVIKPELKKRQIDTGGIRSINFYNNPINLVFSKTGRINPQETQSGTIKETALSKVVQIEVSNSMSASCLETSDSAVKSTASNTNQSETKSLPDLKTLAYGVSVKNLDICVQNYQEIFGLLKKSKFDEEALVVITKLTGNSRSLDHIIAYLAKKSNCWKTMELTQDQFARKHMEISGSEFSKRYKRVEFLVRFCSRPELIGRFWASALDEIFTISNARSFNDEQVRQILSKLLALLVSDDELKIKVLNVSSVIEQLIPNPKVNKTERDTEEGVIERKCNNSSIGTTETSGNCNSTCTPEDGNDQAESNKSHSNSKSALPKQVLSAPESFTIDETTILLQLKEVFKPLEVSDLSRDTYCQISALLFEEAKLFKSLAEAKDH